MRARQVLTASIAVVGLVAIAVSAPAAEAKPPPRAPDRWVQAAPMLLGRALHEMALLEDGRVLVPGGLNVHYAGGTVPLAEIFDPASGRWSRTAPMRSFHSKHTVTALRDGRVLVAGGEGRVAVEVRGNPLTQSEVYDPATDTWSVTDPMASEVPFNHSAVRLRDGRVLVAGGSWQGTSSAGVLRVAQLFDPKTNSWQATKPMRHARSYHASALLRDGRVLVAGGRDATGASMTTVEVWDPQSGDWSEVASLPVPHHNETNAAVVLRDGQVLIAGGSNRSDPGLFSSTTQIFDPRTGAWRVAAPLRIGRNDHAIVALRDGRVLVAGGQVWFHQKAMQVVATTSTEIYDPETDTWSKGPPMHVERSNAAALPLTDGSILVTGGLHLPLDGAYVAEARVERFEPGDRKDAFHTLIPSTEAAARWAAALGDRPGA